MGFGHAGHSPAMASGHAGHSRAMGSGQAGACLENLAEKTAHFMAHLGQLSAKLGQVRPNPEIRRFRAMFSEAYVLTS